MKTGKNERPIVIFFIIVLLFFGCNKRSTKESEGQESREKRIIVESVELRKSDYSFTLSFTGIIKPFARVDTGFKIAGRIDKIFFDEGDDVLKGDILAKLEKAELEASFRQAQASFNKAKRTYERSKKLLQQNGTISPSEVENAEADYEVKKAAMELSGIQLENAEIFAPISGKLAFKRIEEKEIVLPNMTYYTIMNTDDVILEIGVPEYLITRFSPGQIAVAVVDAYQQKRFTGRLYKVAIAANDTNKFFKVEVKIPNKHELLKPGMIANVRIEVETFKDIYLIPLNAIMELNGSKYIYIKRGHKAAKMKLKNFRIHKDNLILLDSLVPEDRIIVKGQQLLHDGAVVYETYESQK